MSTKVVKFGGSSLSDAAQFQKARDIIHMDPDRAFVIVSAPGKRYEADGKITDLLYRMHEKRQSGGDYLPTLRRIASRYQDIRETLKLKTDITAQMNEVEHRLRAGATQDYCASRGEYLTGLLMADYMGYAFIDPAECIRFNDRGLLDANVTQELLSKKLKNAGRAVIPGFYGATPDGRIQTFSRGGSDITGAIVARAAYADIYENWTDVSGFLMADPKIVDHPLEIAHITYRELRELSYSGASVLHEDSVFPVHRAGIPTNIRNTNHPEHAGTLITIEAADSSPSHTITGIAGKKDFSVIAIEKAMMNAELGFGRRVLEAIEQEGVSFEHLPTGIDTMCIVVPQAALEGKREKIIANIVDNAAPDMVTIHDDMAIIATVGRGMVHTYGTAARLFKAMSLAHINVRMIDQGSSEISIIVGVDNRDFEKTIRAIYAEFVDHV
jgi:aspartate kinase